MRQSKGRAVSDTEPEFLPALRIRNASSLAFIKPGGAYCIGDEESRREQSVQPSNDRDILVQLSQPDSVRKGCNY